MIIRELRGGLFPEGVGPTAEDMQGIADMVIQRVRQRTEGGRDADETAFEPLSEGYAKAKTKAGLPGVANLTVSGRMLNDMQVTSATEREAVIGFVGAGGGGVRGTFVQRSRALAGADKALYHCETGAGKSRVIRNFFGFSASDADAIAAAVDQIVAAAWEQR
jgi:hypothetical protein